MEITRNREKLLKPIISVALFGGIALSLTSCAAGSHEITADKPVKVLDKQESQRFVSTQESPGYPHYEEVYTLIVEQCERNDDPIAGKDGCMDLSVKVDDTIFNEYQVGDSFSFNKSQRGYPLENSK